MLGLFSPKPAHPLADEKERQRVLGELAGADALSALKRSVDWLKTLADVAGMLFALRSMLIRQIDDVAQRSARIIGREYLTMAHLSDEEDMRLWRASRTFWAQLGCDLQCLPERFHPFGRTTRRQPRRADARGGTSDPRLRYASEVGPVPLLAGVRDAMAEHRACLSLRPGQWICPARGQRLSGRAASRRRSRGIPQRPGIPDFVHGRLAAVRNRDRRTAHRPLYCRDSTWRRCAALASPTGSTPSSDGRRDASTANRSAACRASTSV